MLFEQIRSCHNSATEFLRQYWSAILPSVPGALGGQTPGAKDAKAAKMASYLKNTSTKIEAIVQTAQITGFDPERVRKVPLHLSSGMKQNLTCVLNRCLPLLLVQLRWLLRERGKE